MLFSSFFKSWMPTYDSWVQLLVRTKEKWPCLYTLSSALFTVIIETIQLNRRRDGSVDSGPIKVGNHLAQTCFVNITFEHYSPHDAATIQITNTRHPWCNYYNILLKNCPTVHRQKVQKKKQLATEMTLQISKLPEWTKPISVRCDLGDAISSHPRSTSVLCLTMFSRYTLSMIISAKSIVERRRSTKKEK